MMHIQVASNARWNDRYPRINELVGELHQRKPVPSIHVDVLRIAFSCMSECLGWSHELRISTFLVTNAQCRPKLFTTLHTSAVCRGSDSVLLSKLNEARFPEAIRNLDPITQLYVSQQPNDSWTSV